MLQFELLDIVEEINSESHGPYRLLYQATIPVVPKLNGFLRYLALLNHVYNEGEYGKVRMLIDCIKKSSEFFDNKTLLINSNDNPVFVNEIAIWSGEQNNNYIKTIEQGLKNNVALTLEDLLGVFVKTVQSDAELDCVSLDDETDADDWKGECLDGFSTHEYFGIFNYVYDCVIKKVDLDINVINSLVA